MTGESRLGPAVLRKLPDQHGQPARRQTALAERRREVVSEVDAVLREEVRFDFVPVLREEVAEPSSSPRLVPFRDLT